jgi:hypothetical protein
MARVPNFGPKTALLQDQMRLENEGTSSFLLQKRWEGRGSSDLRLLRRSEVAKRHGSRYIHNGKHDKCLAKAESKKSSSRAGTEASKGLRDY